MSISSKPGIVTESITKTTFTETTVQRVTNTKIIEDVQLSRGGGPLGLSIIGGSDHSCVPFGTGEQGIYISKIIPGGAAADTGKLRMGDRVLKVNAVDVKCCTHQEAVLALLQQCEVMILQVQHDPLPLGFAEIDIVKGAGEKLGMVIKGGIKGQPGNPLDGADEGVFCVRINPGGAAARDPRIKVGLRIIEVNGQSLLGATHQEAVNILRNTGDDIKLHVCHGFDPQALENLEDGTEQQTPVILPTLNGNSSTQSHNSSLDRTEEPRSHQNYQYQEEAVTALNSSPIVPSPAPTPEPVTLAPYIPSPEYNYNQIPEEQEPSPQSHYEPENLEEQREFIEQDMLTETPRKMSQRPPIATKPMSPHPKLSGVSEPSTNIPPPPFPVLSGDESSNDIPPQSISFPILSGGEHMSLPPQTNSDSPMPELLSLKDRLKLFEKEIEQQTIPEPKKDRKFSFLSEDELSKMKEEEAARIANLTRLDLETLDSLTSMGGMEDTDTDALLEQVEEITRVGPEEIELPGSDHAQESAEEKKEKRSVWRKERLRSLEEDTEQAQQIAQRISELSMYTDEGEDNATFTHPTDTMGNITDTIASITPDATDITPVPASITPTPAATLTDGHELEQETETDTDTDKIQDTDTDKMATSEDQNTGPNSPVSLTEEKN